MSDLKSRVVRSLRAGTLGEDVREGLRHRRATRSVIETRPADAVGTRSSWRLNRLAEGLGGSRAYLEVGVEHGRTFEAVESARRVAVDPRPLFSLRRLPPGVEVVPTTSRAFFDALGPDVRFDLVFLDGLHTYRQTYEDLINALAHLSSPGVIVIDDVVPTNALAALPDLRHFRAERARLGVTQEAWEGDVFRMIPLIAEHHPELEMRTILGSPGSQMRGARNCQTVVLPRGGAVRAVDRLTLDGYERLSYDDVFSAGPPASFAPGTEEEVLAAVVERLMRPA